MYLRKCEGGTLFLYVGRRFVLIVVTREGATPTSRKSSLTSSVSIHAPVKVRRDTDYPDDTTSSFNSRTREGATKLKNNFQNQLLFQFTHP